MTPAEVIASLLGLGAILQGLDAASAQRSNASTQAIKALSKAVANTQDHIGSADPDVPMHELTHLWFTASAAFADAGDTHLARLCQIKGDYWTNPKAWSKAQVQEAGITLRTMQRELRRLLDRQRRD